MWKGVSKVSHYHRDPRGCLWSEISLICWLQGKLRPSKSGGIDMASLLVILFTITGLYSTKSRTHHLPKRLWDIVYLYKRLQNYNWLIWETQKYIFIPTQICYEWFVRVVIYTPSLLPDAYELLYKLREGWNDWFVVLLPYGPELRSSRQSLHRFLQPSAIPDYFPEQTITAHKLAERLIRSPEDFVKFVRL